MREIFGRGVHRRKFSSLYPILKRFDLGKGDNGQLGHGSLEEELLPRLVPLTNCKIVTVVCKDSFTGPPHHPFPNYFPLSLFITALYNEKNDLYWFGLGQPKPLRIKFSFGYPSLHRVGSFKVLLYFLVSFFGPNINFLR